jgi:two-component system sensor histidine kinase RegB
MSAATAMPSSAAINLRRLVALRNITLAGQALAVWVAVSRLELALPLRALAGIILGMALVNLLSWWRLRRPWPVHEAELSLQLLLDVAALTGLLYFSGGSTNPFAPLYLLPLTLTAVALPWAYTWAMAAVTVGCYSLLLFVYVPLPSGAGMHGDDFSLHVIGMWLGFILSAGLIAYFAVKMSQTVRERDRLAALMREGRLRDERVLALGTLAAGAAHELGTPLSTLAVLAKDIEPAKGITAAKLAILREQIGRCKEILASLSASAGEVRAESGERRPLDEYLAELIAKWRAQRPDVALRHDLRGAQPAPRLVVEQTLTQAVTNILNNAADASPHDVEVIGRWSDTELTLEIADRGPGLAPGAGQRAGEALFTTKHEGLGLGLFLTYTTLRRLGGEVRLLDRDGGGVRCRLTLPLAPVSVP